MNTPLFQMMTTAMVATGLSVTLAMAYPLYFWSNMFRYPGYVPKKPS